MLLFIKQMGPFGFLMIIISIVIAVISIKKAIDLFGGKDRPAADLEKGLHAILFWGIISAVLGILGQISGIYNALNAISRATEINPRIVYMGFAESFTTTLYGLTTLLISAIIWFAFFMKCRKIVAALKV